MPPKYLRCVDADHRRGWSVPLTAPRDPALDAWIGHALDAATPLDIPGLPGCAGQARIATGVVLVIDITGALAGRLAIAKRARCATAAWSDVAGSLPMPPAPWLAMRGNPDLADFAERLGRAWLSGNL